MPKSQINGNFIDKTFSLVANILLRIIPKTSGEKAGPMLRASGIQWDLRKVDHYECYDEFDWQVKWQKEGDSLARYLVRIIEMTESIKIIQQALEGIP